jgi:hypothetical protein
MLKDLDWKSAAIASSIVQGAPYWEALCAEDLISQLGLHPADEALIDEVLVLLLRGEGPDILAPYSSEVLSQRATHFVSDSVAYRQGLELLFETLADLGVSGATLGWFHSLPWCNPSGLSLSRRSELADLSELNCDTQLVASMALTAWRRAAAKVAAAVRPFSHDLYRLLGADLHRRHLESINAWASEVTLEGIHRDPEIQGMRQQLIRLRNEGSPRGLLRSIELQIDARSRREEALLIAHVGEATRRWPLCTRIPSRSVGALVLQMHHSLGTPLAKSAWQFSLSDPWFAFVTASRGLLESDDTTYRSDIEMGAFYAFARHSGMTCSQAVEWANAWGHAHVSLGSRLLAPIAPRLTPVRA